MFSDKLANHDSTVSSNVWSGIQSQIGIGATSTTVAAKGISMASKWIIGISSVVAVSAVAVVLNYSDTSTELVIPNQNISDSTELAADNKIDSDENNETVKQYELPSASDVVLSVEKSVVSATEIPEEISLEAGSTVSQTPETLIIKQAVKSTPDKAPVYIDENKALQESKQVVTRECGGVLPVRPEVKGSVEAWKNTNIFSPNNDGVNDLFFLDCKDLKEFSITIVNEKNAVVFVSDDPKFKWDGTDYRTGEMVPEGNYGYIVFAVDIYKNPIKIFNSLKISR